VYRETRRVLAEELGLDPSPELRELEGAILRQDPTLRAACATPIVPTGAHPGSRRRRWIAGGVVGGVILAAGVLAALALGRADSASPETSGDTALAVTHTSPTGVTTTQAPPPVQRTRSHSTTPPATTAALPATTTTSTTTGESATGSVPRKTERTEPAPPAGSARTTTTGRTTPPPATTPERTTPRSTPPPARSISIRDSFDSDYLDPTIWNAFETDGNVSVVESGGRLLVTVGAAAQPSGPYNQIAASVDTRCSFTADVDARVDFELLEWPVADNVFAGLNAIFADSAAGRQFDPLWGDAYTGWVKSANGSVPLPDTSGSLRIARNKGVETTYFWHRGGWQKIAVSAAGGAAVFSLQALWFPNGGTHHSASKRPKSPSTTSA
jgi:hypothetical protein